MSYLLVRDMGTLRVMSNEEYWEDPCADFAIEIIAVYSTEDAALLHLKHVKRISE